MHPDRLYLPRLYDAISFTICPADHDLPLRSSADSLLAATTAPVGQPPLGELNVLFPRFLPFLRDKEHGKEDLAVASLLCEEEAINDTLAVNLDLPDVATKVIHVWMTSAGSEDLFHGDG